MIKIFRCECRRLLCNKFSSACWRCCCSTPGRCSTPWPSPAWPIRPLFALELRGLPGAAAAPCVGGGPVFPHLFTSARERRAAVLTAATPADPRRYALARCAAALVGVALLCLAALALAALLYARLFGWTDWGSLALPALVILGPSGVRPGQRLAAGPPAALAALCVDAPPLCPGGPASAGGPGAVERRPVHVLSPDSGDAGPGFLPPGGGLGRPRAASGCRGAPLLVAGKGKKVYNQ